MAEKQIPEEEPIVEHDIDAPVVETEPVIETEGEVPEVTQEDAVAELKAKLAAAEQRAKESDDRAIQARQEASKAANTVENTNLQLVTTAINSTKRDAETLKANYAAALAAQDFDGATEIQDQWMEAKQRLAQLEQGKAAMEEQIKNPRITDPVEALAAQLSPPSANWVRKHPEYARDPRLTRKMVRAHEDALEDGHKEDTPEYFAAVESTLGIGRREQEVQHEESAFSEAAAPVQRRSAPAAAPVSRTSNTNGSSGGNTIRLSAEEREAAAASGLTDAEYIKNKLALKKEGRITH